MTLNLPIVELVLERGDSGLGFNIRGGVDIPYAPNDPGIFVTRVKEDGSAFRDGRLKEGDKVLEVNGKSIEHVTHNEAVQIFITAGNTVRLKVQHGAYAHLVRLEEGGGASSGSPVKTIVVVAIVLAIVGIGAFAVLRMQEAS